MSNSPSINTDRLASEAAPILGASSSPTLRELAPTRREIPVTVTLAEQGTILLQVPRHEFGVDDRPVTLGGVDFKPKEETHITVVGFKLSKEMKKALSDPEKAAEIHGLLETTNRSGQLVIHVDSASPILHLARDISIDRAGGGKEVQHQESLILPVGCHRIEALVNDIGRIIGAEIPPPYLHVTLYTLGADHGIGVPTESVLETLKVGEIPAPQFEQLARGATAKIPVTPLECGEELLRALGGPEPVSNFEKLLKHPSVMHTLRELVALKEVPQDPRHHPEGSVYIHTMRVLEETAKLCDSHSIVGYERQTALLGALFHDIGKGAPGITVIHHEPGGTIRISAHGHEKAGVEPAQRLLTELGLTEYERGVLTIVEHHMTLPARFRDVEKGKMSPERCIERTRSFIETKLNGMNPEIFLACTIADWRGRGLPDSAERRESFIRGFTEVFNRARGT